MHIVTPESIDYQLRLLAELAWLKQEHPDKTVLIALAEREANRAYATTAWEAKIQDALKPFKQWGGRS